MTPDEAVAKLKEVPCPRCLSLGGLAIMMCGPGRGECEWIGQCAGCGYKFDLEFAAKALERLKQAAHVTEVRDLQCLVTEASGYSPSTLAVNIAALICVACFARERGDETAARFLEEYADFLEAHVERWTVTSAGTFVDGVSRHYIRIHPVSVGDRSPDEDPDRGALTIANQPPGTALRVPAKDVVDAGFLEPVRYGIRCPDDPLIVDSLHVVDAVLKAQTPYGPAWRRYNHDGYGQCEHGGPYVGWGKGRAWPLLTVERGHYELAAGRDVSSFIRTMERFAAPTGLLPEQVWDEADRPDVHMSLGGPTGSATPLMWAHAEYIKLLRSVHDGTVVDLIPEVAERYRSAGERRALEIWKPNRQVRFVRRGSTLRIQAPAPFRLRWTREDWQTADDTSSTGVSLGIEFVDIPIVATQQAPVRFTFFWTADDRWEYRDYDVAVVDR